MGLATIIRKEKLKQNEFRILILGLDNAGKSTVLNKWIKLTSPSDSELIDTQKICPTFGFEIKTITTLQPSSNRSLRLNFWDIGGQKSIRPFWRNYYEETDAIVWVIDSTDSDRFDTCKKELESVLNADRLLGASLLILANKQDSPSAISLDHIRDSLGLSQLNSDHHHWIIRATSAINGMGIEDSFNWLVDEVSQSRFK